MEGLNGKKSFWVRGSCIGKGSYGTVSLGVREQDGVVFAVKSAAMGGERDSLLALENEIRILKSISSPYVVKYFGDDVTCEGTTPFRNLHMEYLPGGTVADVAKSWLSTGGDVDEGIVRSYTWCIVSALSYLHSRGIVHCDVKGRNVLVGSVPGSAKLADFGSAVEFPAGSRISPRGSPLWMAPEVVRGDYQGPESDIWSLGCTIIEMVTGKPPWEDQSAAVDTLCRIGYSGELPQLPTQLSELGRDFLEKCLRREHNRRWSCDQLLQHPFISMCSRQNLTAHYSSPRCVLDCINSDFEEEANEDVYDVEEGKNENLNLRARDRIRELDSGAGANWELDDEWLVVREGTSSEHRRSLGAEREIRSSSAGYSDSIQEDDSDTNPNCLVEEENFDQYDVVISRQHLSREGRDSEKGGDSSCKFTLLTVFLIAYYYYNLVSLNIEWMHKNSLQLFFHVDKLKLLLIT